MADASDHHGLPHAASAESDFRLVLIALILISTFLIVEVAAAVLGHSLVLFADAGHMLTDVGALILSAWAIRLAKRPAGRALDIRAAAGRDSLGPRSTGWLLRASLSLSESKQSRDSSRLTTRAEASCSLLPSSGPSSI